MSLISAGSISLDSTFKLSVPVYIFSENFTKFPFKTHRVQHRIQEQRSAIPNIIKQYGSKNGKMPTSTLRALKLSIPLETGAGNFRKLPFKTHLENPLLESLDGGGLQVIIQTQECKKACLACP
jgi:hypothetical protein